MNKISEYLIGFDVAEEERYRSIIQSMLDADEVRPYSKFVNEPPEEREKRRKRAEKEAKQARKLKRKAGVADAGDGDDNGENSGGMTSLALALQANAKKRANFVDDLERKYRGGAGGTEGKSRKGKGG
jgi:DnaJ family protein C protein 9